jgi:hypothetical protein
MVQDTCTATGARLTAKAALQQCTLKTCNYQAKMINRSWGCYGVTQVNKNPRKNSYRIADTIYFLSNKNDFKRKI